MLRPSDSFRAEPRIEATKAKTTDASLSRAIRASFDFVGTFSQTEFVSVDILIVTVIPSLRPAQGRT
jgi:hypothetical protein